jgi:heat shock protein HspQ
MQSVAKEGVVVKKLAVPFQSVVEDTKVRKESHYYHLVMEANK